MTAAARLLVQTRALRSVGLEPPRVEREGEREQILGDAATRAHVDDGQAQAEGEAAQIPGAQEGRHGAAVRSAHVARATNDGPEPNRG